MLTRYSPDDGVHLTSKQFRQNDMLQVVGYTVMPWLEVFGKEAMYASSVERRAPARGVVHGGSHSRLVRMVPAACGNRRSSPRSDLPL